MRKVFDAKAARDGGVVRRSLRDIERIVGRDRFRREIERLKRFAKNLGHRFSRNAVKRFRYHAVENAGQLVIFCNNERMSVWC
jgi:hypothetical protein